MRTSNVILLGMLGLTIVSTAAGQTVAHWKFQDGNDGQIATEENAIVDSVGGHRGTPIGNPAYRRIKTSEGELTGLEFIADHFLTVPDSPKFVLTKSLTIEAVIYTYPYNKGTDDSPILIRGDNRGGLDSYKLSIWRDGKLSFMTCDKDNDFILVKSSQAVPVKEKVHVAATFDAATGKSTVYIDGNEVGSATKNITPIGDLLPGANPGIGIGNYQSTQVNSSFPGVIFEVRLSDVALEPSRFLINENHSLRRNTETDTVVLANGNALRGTLANEAYEVESVVGTLKPAAAQVVGMVSQKDGTVKLHLADGQIVCGKPPKGELSLTGKDGNAQTVPFSAVKEWSYRISDAKPARPEPVFPVALLPSGDELTVDAKGFSIELRTAVGLAKLNAADLLELSFNDPNGVKALLINGSVLTGTPEQEKLSLSLKLGPKVTADMGSQLRLVFSRKKEVCPWLARLKLTNGDEIIGSLPAQKINLQTGTALTDLDITSIKTLTTGGGEGSEVNILCWDGSTHTGKLASGGISVAVLPELTVTIPAGKLAGLVRTVSFSEESVEKHVAELIAQLGANEYHQREKATAELTKMVLAIADILKKHQDDPDPEIRMRLRTILENFSRPNAGHQGVPSQP